MGEYFVKLKDKKERPVTVTVNPNNTFTVMGEGHSEMDGPSLYRYVTEDLAHTPWEFICNFRYLPLMERQTVFYPDQYKKRVASVLKTVYLLLSRHGLTCLLDAPLYFYGDVTEEVRGKHIIAFGKTYINVKMASKTVMVSVLLHELGHELYHRLSPMKKLRITAKFHTMRKKRSLTFEGKTIKLYGSMSSKCEGIPLTVTNIDNEAVYFTAPDGTGELPFDGIEYLTILKDDGMGFTHYRRSSDSFFPTHYSMVNPQEWWCEVFSRTLMGEVTGEPAAFVQSLIASHQR